MWYDRIEAWNDVYPGVLDWYAERVQQVNLKMASPTLDGTNTQLIAVDVGDILQKAELTTADAGAANAVYDLGVFVQYKAMANTYGALPANTWSRLGYRAVSAASATSGVGIAEASAVPTGVEATYFEIAPTPKEIALTHDYSNRLVEYSRMADAVTIAQNRQVAEIDFFRSLNADMLVDGDTLASNNFESIDRVTASSGEATALSWTANDEDLYGVDRSAETWFDANSDHNSGTDRNLTEDLINALRRDAEPYWDVGIPNQKVFITGFDTWDRWSALSSASERFQPTFVSMGVNGIQTSPGQEGGFAISSWDQIPVIRDDQVAADTISRLYLLDTDHVGISWARPPAYQESDTWFEVGFLVRGVRYGIGEVITTKPIAQSKLRDLK